MTISNTVQNAIIGDDNTITGGLIGAGTLFLVNHFVVSYLYSHERLERLIEGEPDVLIENGVVNMEHLKRELITTIELETAAHKQGFTSLDEVDRAVLDQGGSIAFFAQAADARTGTPRRHHGAPGSDFGGARTLAADFVIDAPSPARLRFLRFVHHRTGATRPACGRP